MSKLFLSHSTKDKELVLQFDKKLRDYKYGPWIDIYELEVGDVLAENISEAIKASDFCLIFLSENALKSTWVDKEVEIANENSIPVIPIWIANCDLSEKWKEILYADLRDLDFEGIEFNKIIKKIGPSELAMLPSAFLEERLQDAFPGQCGLFEVSSKEMLQRLSVFLRNPLVFADNQPLWWFRGNSCLTIKEFRFYDDLVRIEGQELKLERLWVNKGPTHWKNFVYVESSNISPLLEEETIGGIEEYGIYDGEPISRRYIDDGSIFKEGKRIDVAGTPIYQRWVSKRNMIICSHNSNINQSEYDEMLKKVLDEIILGNKSVEDLRQKIDKIPKRDG